MFVERDVFEAPSSRKTLGDLGKLRVELEIRRRYLKNGGDNGGDNGASFGMDKGAIRGVKHSWCFLFTLLFT